MGWRLGGKGANGRRADAGQRIEEHGLHVWGGFYANAFRTMRECYAGLRRPAGSPLATAEDAFIAAPHVVWEEYVAAGGGTGRSRSRRLRACRATAASCRPAPVPRAALAWFTIDWIAARSRTRASGTCQQREPLFGAAAAIADRRRARFPTIRRFRLFGAPRRIALCAAAADGATSVTTTRSWPASSLLALAALRPLMRDDRLARRIAAAVHHRGPRPRDGAGHDPRSDFHERGFTAVDDLDFADWLGRHGASRSRCSQRRCAVSTIISLPTTNGDRRPASHERGDGPLSLAAAGLHVQVQPVFQDDVGNGRRRVWAALRDLREQRRAVRFFHEVLELVPDATTTAIATVRINRQVTTKADYAAAGRSSTDCQVGRRSRCSIKLTRTTPRGSRVAAAISKIHGADGRRHRDRASPAAAISTSSSSASRSARTA